MTIFATTYFPKLIGDYWGVLVYPPFHYNKPITQTWRHIMRQRAINEHQLEVILLNLRHGNKFRSIPILKEICNNELKEYIRIKKIKRNNERALLSLHGIRENIPLDVINSIQEYMTFVKYF